MHIFDNLANKPYVQTLYHNNNWWFTFHNEEVTMLLYNTVIVTIHTCLIMSYIIISTHLNVNKYGKNYHT